MAKRGPSKKPTKLKLIDGNPGKRPLPDDEPDPELAVNSKPSRSLKGRIARAKYRELATKLEDAGILAITDLEALHFYCELYEDYRDAADKVRVDGREAETARGTPTRSQAFRDKLDLYRELKGLLREFGMTPSSRTGVSAAPGHRQGAGASEWDEFDEEFD